MGSSHLLISPGEEGWTLKPKDAEDAKDRLCGWGNLALLTLNIWKNALYAGNRGLEEHWLSSLQKLKNFGDCIYIANHTLLQAVRGNQPDFWYSFVTSGILLV